MRLLIPRRRGLQAGFACVMTPVILAAGFSWHVAGRLVAPRPATIAAAPNDFPASEVTFPSEDGSPLVAWHRRRAPSRGCVVLLHGIRGDRRASLPRAKLIDKAGYSTLLVDLRAHGESPGDAITLGRDERLDARAAVRYARRQHPGEPVGVVGFSLGGAAAVLASPLDIDALVLEAVFPTIDAAVDNRTRRRLGVLGPIASWSLLAQLYPRLGVSTSDLRPIDQIASAGCPVLVVGGAIDPQTTPADTRRLFAAAAEPKQLGWFEGLGHQNYARWRPAEYDRLVVGFLERTMRLQPTARRPAEEPG